MQPPTQALAQALEQVSLQPPEQEDAQAEVRQEVHFALPWQPFLQLSEQPPSQLCLQPLLHHMSQLFEQISPQLPLQLFEHCPPHLPEQEPEQLPVHPSPQVDLQSFEQPAVQVSLQVSTPETLRFSLIQVNWSDIFFKELITSIVLPCCNFSPISFKLILEPK